ncbi:hypothetical protein CJF42_01530 [Pseudoalteromonas sp. NBT06-2]|uniref:tetratricopeptide repeat protein n=1 Tax=Pseudoalteromonas sp. NBT06-2 TaxID=2025950 RepID=UPI000BA592FC|nr:tetratricopeptide repeat protein [Pseudoalteromonas sp. NBT06-2]PAJ76186.1 hypothetical protein CJF42_01530 [Pseudoalteromonas sp. NBT06-2]
MTKALYLNIIFLILTAFSLAINAASNPFKIAADINSPKNLIEQISLYEKAIEELESTEGVYSEKLAQELANLADIYQKQEKHDLAITTFNRSLHLNRINDGLYSKAQLPILDKIIISLKKQKKWKKVHEKYNYLYWLNNRNFSEQDAQMLQVLIKIANWNLTSYAMSYSPNPAQDLYNAYYLYKQALNISENVYGPFDKQNIYILNNKMIISYFFATFDLSAINSNLVDNSNFTTTSNYQNQIISLKRTSFTSGRDTILNEIKILENQNDVDYYNISKVKLKLADWYLLFEKRQSAMRLYNEAYQFAILNDDEHIFTKDLFQKPIALPYLPNLTTNTREIISKDLLLSNEKYIQASFDVTKHGRAKNIRVVNSNMKESTRLRSLALKSLRHTKFRPKLVKGIPIRTEQMKLHIFPK